jgi:hypothetical protein
MRFSYYDRLSGAQQKIYRRSDAIVTLGIPPRLELGDRGVPARITAWMRTAQRLQVVAFKTFLRTLIHELCHHLDYELFALEETFHTEGFYKRESSLVSALLAQRDAKRTAAPGAKK